MQTQDSLGKRPVINTQVRRLIGQLTHTGCLLAAVSLAPPPAPVGSADSFKKRNKQKITATCFGPVLDQPYSYVLNISGSPGLMQKHRMVSMQETQSQKISRDAAPWRHEARDLKPWLSPLVSSHPRLPRRFKDADRKISTTGCLSPQTPNICITAADGDTRSFFLPNNEQLKTSDTFFLLLLLL